MVMSSLITLVAFICIINDSYAWTSFSAAGMHGVTYAGGTIYDVNTMCVYGDEQGYACDGRNWGDAKLEDGVVSGFCSQIGSSKQYGFGHGVIGVSPAQKCGECAQLRVPRLDGTYNYMLVMMVDTATYSMEVGTVEIDYLLEGTKWVKGDRADFDFRIRDCTDIDFSDGGSTPVQAPTPTPRPTTKSPTPKPVSSPVESPVESPVTPPTESSGGGGDGSDGVCRTSSNWGEMRLNPYPGSNTIQFFSYVRNTPTPITSFSIKGSAASDSWTECVKQNVDFWQCYIPGGLTEPASVRLNSGTYYGYNIIESMSPQTHNVYYPSSRCGASFTLDDGSAGDSMALTTIIAIVIACLIAIGCIIAGGVCLYKYNKKKKGSAYFEENVDTPDVDADADAVDGDEVDTNVEVVATTQE